MALHAIHTEEISRSFGDTIAVDKLSLTVEIGEVFGFLGHNGAGKTTTVRLLNGVLTPNSGEIRVLGLNPQSEGTLLRARTGVLTETPSLDERLSARENLTIYADLYSVPVQIVDQRVTALLETFGLAERASEKVGSYSKGMKQRLAIARAFLHEPELIFLDEPTSGLDPIAAQEVHQMIRHFSRDEGRTVFLCTHNLVEAQRLCDRVAVMEHGKMVAVGTPHELASEIGAEIRYTIEVAQGQEGLACNILDQVLGVQSIQSDDAELILTLSDREVIPDMLALLLNADVRVYAVTPQNASLEDIYIAIHQRKGQG